MEICIAVGIGLWFTVSILISCIMVHRDFK